MEAFHAAGLLFGPRAEVDRGEALFTSETAVTGFNPLKSFVSRRGALFVGLNALPWVGGGLPPELPYISQTPARLASKSCARAAAVA